MSPFPYNDNIIHTIEKSHYRTKYISKRVMLHLALAISNVIYYLRGVWCCGGAWYRCFVI